MQIGPTSGEDMSLENLKEYARLCATDPGYYARSKEIGLADMDQHMEEARRGGLDWTMADLVAFRKELLDTEGDLEDLTEEELEMVAAGLITSTGVALGFAGVVGLAVGGVAGAGVGGAVTAAGDSGTDW